jgi:ankyrin repeat protein
VGIRCRRHGCGGSDFLEIEHAVKCIRPKHVAARFGLLPFVQDSLLADGEANCRGYNGETPLMAAARWGHLEVVKLLYSNTDLDKNALDDGGRTTCGAAVEENRIDVLRYLLDDSQIDVKLGNPLAKAILKGGNGSPITEAIKLLLLRPNLHINVKLHDSVSTPFWLAMSST